MLEAYFKRIFTPLSRIPTKLSAASRILTNLSAAKTVYLLIGRAVN
jgi:hypothetical protein